MQAGQRMGWEHLGTGPNHDKGKSCHGWAKAYCFCPLSRDQDRDTYKPPKEKRLGPLRLQKR